ncbi:hypothetical protein CCACVL1_30322, partial [Corchorus capsularis]
MAAVKKKKKETEADRLSDLPDCLLLRILSLVDTTIAVRTGVLSNRWSCLWTRLPILNFDSQLFKTYGAFHKFVIRVFSQRCGSEQFNLVRLNFHSKSGSTTVVDRVIRYAVSHFVQEIHMNHSCLIDRRLISCTSLTTLHLEN